MMVPGTSAWASSGNVLAREACRPSFDAAGAGRLSEEIARWCRASVEASVAPGAFDSIESLTAWQPFLGALAEHLGVAPQDMGARLHSEPADPAIDMIPGAAAIEHEMGTQFFGAVCLGRHPATPDLSAEGAPVEDTPWALPAPAAHVPVPHPDQRPLFSGVGRRWSAEGAILGVLFTLIVIGVAWPENTVPVTRTGPHGFPVTVHIRDDDMAIENRSAENWSCEVQLGYSVGAGTYKAVFPLRRYTTRIIPYATFRGDAGGADDEGVRRAARAKGTVQCGDPSGGVHSWTW